jgi:hypothetical protein
MHTNIKVDMNATAAETLAKLRAASESFECAIIVANVAPRDPALRLELLTRYPAGGQPESEQRTCRSE